MCGCRSGETVLQIVEWPLRWNNGELGLPVRIDGEGLTSNITTTINTDERAMQACDCRARLFVFIRSHVAPKGGDPSLSPSHIHPD
ncbi:hypothetical protein ANTPLA_LOCUS5472 [Anthophora plagiata]